jgi:hypothetical protein
VRNITFSNVKVANGSRADRHRPVLLRPGRGAVCQPDRRNVLVPAGAAGVQRRQAVHGRQHGGRAPDAGAGERVPRRRCAGTPTARRRAP